MSRIKDLIVIMREKYNVIVVLTAETLEYLTVCA